MSVSLNHQIPLGDHASLGHDSRTSPSSFGPSPLGRSLSSEASQVQQEQQQHDWNPSRSLFTAAADSYGSPRYTPLPTSNTHSEAHFTHQDSSAIDPHFQSNMPDSNPGGVGSDGLRRSPNLHPGQDQPPGQHHQPVPHHCQNYSTASSRDSLLPSSHSIPSQARNAYEGGNGSSSSNARDSGSSMNYRGHPSPTPGLGMTSFQSKLGGGIHQTLPNQHPFHVYSQHPMHHLTEPHHHHQQHSLPSPTHAGTPMRLIPPPLSSQAGMPGLVPPPLGSSGESRGYSPYSHPGSAPPHSPALSGPVMPNPGQMTLLSNVGMPYGSGGSSPGPGSGSGAGAGSSYVSRGRPYLYHPHQISHHQLPGILGGKGYHGPGGPLTGHERPFRCDQCPQSFNRNHDLKRHKRIHLAVKPFPCNYCDKSFSRKDALKVRTTLFFFFQISFSFSFAFSHHANQGSATGWSKAVGSGHQTPPTPASRTQTERSHPTATERSD